MIENYKTYVDIGIILYSIANSIFISKYIVRNNWSRAFALSLIQTFIILGRLFLLK